MKACAARWHDCMLAAGYQPVTYESAEAFLNDAKRPVFDCLVVDVRLDGTDRCKSIRYSADGVQDVGRVGHSEETLDQ
jgi:FixJ family two-component response regulator